MLTRRGRLVLLLGAAVYVAAWAFGSEPLYPVAVGLLLAVVLAWAWVRVLDRPMQLSRRAWGAERVEGEDVPVNVELAWGGRWTPSTLPLVDRIERVGRFDLLLRRGDERRQLGGRYVLRGVPRGRYSFGESVVVLEDPFGLERREITLPSPGALLVYPRLTDLDGLFSESGAHAQDGRRLLLRRPTGFDLHSVREYMEGESLRKVHWRSTARRGQLMVKDLEDAPRDEVAVLLDAAAGFVTGEPPDSSFDLQVRAAGSILAAHAKRGRRAVLVVNSLAREVQQVRAEDAEWRHTLEILAAVEANGRISVASLLGEEAGAAARALELTVVTAALAPELVNRLLLRATSRRAVSLVYVDPLSFAPEPKHVPQPALLRLQAAGVPIAVLRRGDDLAARLGSGAVREAAHG